MGNLKKDYAHGAIVRMKLENFVTYDSLEFYPGANLNVIIGPNGTGKSSIVCAICLGMAGKPTVLGRAASISDYIKYGCSKATVEIELNNTSGQNFTITRHIYKDNKSDWWLNERSVRLKDIEELVQDLNIQVNNLCQFLPQEKVSEFARLDTYELLENTEKAVGGVELYEKHMELKENSKTAKDLDKEVSDVEESLKREEAINLRLESQVASYLEKKKFEDTVIWLKRKRACLMYQEKRKDYESTKKEKEKINKEVEQVDKELGPLDKKKQRLDEISKKQKDLLSAKSRQIQECMNSSRDLGFKLNDYTLKISEAKSDYAIKESEYKSRKTQLLKINEEIETTRSRYLEAKEGLPNIQESEKEIKKQEDMYRVEQGKVSDKMYEKTTESVKLKTELTELNKKLTNMRNVREEKLAKLKEGFPQAHKALEWLDKNRKQFRGHVYDPMFLLINIKQASVAKYVEASVSNRDLCSLFLFEHSEDMHFFMSEVREKLQLIVNCALVPNKSSKDYYPPKPIEDLKKYGFSSYLREIIDAPEAIMNYLCMYSAIHSIPIGSEYTQKNLDNILPEITDYQRIYTSTRCYTFTKSRYTGKTSSMSTEVNQGYWLTSSIDTQKIDQLEHQKKNLEARVKEVIAEHTNFSEKKKELEAKIDGFQSEKTKLRESRQYIENLNKKYQLHLKKREALANEKNDIFSDAETKVRCVSDFVKKRVKVFAEYAEASRKLLNLNKDKFLATYQDAEHQLEKRQLENELREYNIKKQELVSKVEEMEARVKQAKEDAKHALENASRINEIRLEQGVPDLHKQKFSELPDSLDEIESEIHKCEAISSCSYDVDEKVVEDFRHREKQIEQLKKQYENKKNKLDSQRANYEELKNGWIDEVEKMIGDINVKFTNLFRQLKCAGEISLRVPDISDDFAKYGVKIMVSYRSNEALQELTAWQQSGGEKSVATMMYMIALQEMTKCPFRVVDEINQGMDPTNERKVFDIIVQNSCSKLFAQYFLLTPKLLPDLSFDERTNVICVFNGPNNLPHTKYNPNHFIKLRKDLNAKSRE